MSTSRQQHLYNYSIDEHGNWVCEGNPVADPSLFRLLSRSLFEEGGRYFVRCEGEIHPVQVADAPLVIRYVHVETDSGGNVERVEIELQDGRREPLDATTLRVANNSALYCLATTRRMRARFGKVAYYEITRHLQAEELEEGLEERFFLVIGGRRYDLLPVESLK